MGETEMSSWMRFAPKQYTNAEIKLHKALSKANISFFSQYFIAKFRCDFVIRNVVVEVDGESHNRESRRRKDAWKDRCLRKEGYRVLRFTDKQVDKNPAECVAEIVYALLETKN